ncbi:MAG TPA: serine/threonine-protein kinase [Terriglobales bacterium]|nr:serine/threonine-protein kinase [Terriglobales bacterium]
MAKCRFCGGVTDVSTPFCANCGQPMALAASMTADLNDIGATIDSPSPGPSPRPPSSSRPPSSISSHSTWSQGRFLPGTLIAGRYRIIAVLGKGGMGEVYRADDLSLEQQVALKFLPETATDEATLERFRNEVRIARRISHPNVCRVYDIGEAEHQIFLSMEYIDGEDLGSLLRRIGRISGDKAAEIARKICVGLAAAHTQGVLHRDLKPANIMLNSQGEVLITDFGLAGVATEISDIRSGTPAYMAPEQLTGREVTQRSDIYSLGLVLYELFTGKRAYEGKSYDEILQDRHDRTPSRPSTLVKDLDPAVERVILHCLEPNPTDRPASALSIAAALPGGDPLAAALAAGETPSPQLVAAAGENIGLRVRAAVLWFSVAMVGLIVFYALGVHTSGMDRLDLPYTPEVLSQKARDIVQQLGYTTPPVDSAEWFSFDNDLLDYLGDHVNWDERLKGRPPLLTFERRESPGSLLAFTPHDSTTLAPGYVTYDDPPPTNSGMLSVQVDNRGRLLSFEAMPSQKDTSATVALAYDWKQAFELAGLDMSQFKPAQPNWNPLAATDSRAAWLGIWPGTAYPLRVEAGSYHGKPVFFRLIGDWTKPNRMAKNDGLLRKRIGQVVMALMVLVLIVVSLVIAHRNYRRGKSDIRAAVRLGVLIFTIQIALWICKAHFVSSVGLIGLFVLATSGALFISTLLAVIYTAIEPYVRRRWPQAIVSWTRLMSGKVRDPHVGRDVLYGVLLAITWTVNFEVLSAIIERNGVQPNLCDESFLQGTRSILGTSLWHLAGSIQTTLIFFLFMFVLRVLLRKPWLAAGAFVALWVGIRAATVSPTDLVSNLILFTIIYSIAAFVVLRFGFIALAIGFFLTDLLLNIPVTTHPSAWYASSTIFVLLVVVALAAWGAYTSLGGQKLWQDHPLD